MTDGTLDEAYRRMHHFGPEWGEDQLTNHGPMAVETLVRRRHTVQVAGWVDRYLTRLDDLPGRTAAIDATNWAEALGQGSRIADWTMHFTAELDEAPWRDVLARWWPRLLPGIVAGTTHGVIRVGHAVRALLAAPAEPTGPARTELAHGLAFWAARFQGVPGAVAAAGRLDVAAALRGIPTLTDQDGRVASRLGRLPATPGWSAGLAALRAPADPAQARTLLADLVTAGTIGYLQHGHAAPVLLVHAATAPNAVLHTMPALPDNLWIPSLNAAWAACAAITAAYAPPDAAAPVAVRVIDPAAAFARAVEHGDEHVIKFTDTAVEVFERTGDADALAAADRIATLIDRPGR